MYGFIIFIVYTNIYVIMIPINRLFHTIFFCDRGYLVMLRSNTTKYPFEIKEGVKKTLRRGLMGEFPNTQLDDQIEGMTKVEMMDNYFDSYEEKIRSSVICKVVNQVFKFDLDAMPLSRATIDSYLDHYEKKVTGSEIRKMVNQIFGINLDGIASLEKARISLYSKDQWVVQNDNDLFVIYTGTGDVDVKVFPTEYFTDQTGIEELPNNLQQSLKSLGYSYDEKIGSYYFSNPTGEAVPDVFKGKTIKAIIEVIHPTYSHL